MSCGELISPIDKDSLMFNFTVANDKTNTEYTARVVAVPVDENPNTVLENCWPVKQVVVTWTIDGTEMVRVYSMSVAEHFIEFHMWIVSRPSN
jgi:hypothetical protein